MPIWVQVAGIIIVVIMALIGAVFALHCKRIDKMEKNIEKAADTLKSEVDKKVDEIHCDDRYENLLSRLGRGVDRFDTIDEMLEKQSKLLIGHATMLGEINGKLSVLIKNGNGNRSESKS